jgi:ribonuclease HI
MINWPYSSTSFSSPSPATSPRGQPTFAAAPANPASHSSPALPLLPPGPPPPSLSPRQERSLPSGWTPGFLTLNIRGLRQQPDCDLKLGHVLNVLARDKCCFVSLVDTKLTDPSNFRHAMKRVEALDGGDCKWGMRTRWLARHALCPPDNHASGGVALLVARQLEPHLAECETIGNRVVMQWLATRRGGRLMVVAAYLPHDVDEAAALATRILATITRCLAAGHEVTLMGDLNTTVPANAQLVSDLVAAGMVDVAVMLGKEHYTRFPEGQQAGVPHRLDYVLVSPRLARSLLPHHLTIDRAGCPGGYNPFEVVVGSGTTGKRIALDHASVRLTGVDALPPLFCAALARRHRDALRSSSRRLPDWIAATASQRRAFVALATSRLAGNPTLAECTRNNDVEGAWRVFQGAVVAACSALPTRRVGGSTGAGVLRRGGGAKVGTDQFSQALCSLERFAAHDNCLPLSSQAVATLAKIGFTSGELAVFAARTPNTPPPPPSQVTTAVRLAKDALLSARAAKEASNMASRIRKAVDRRNNSFAASPGMVVESLLARAKPNAAVDHVCIPHPDGTHTVTADPVAVRWHIARQVGQWFAAQPATDPAAMPTFWRNAFAPASHIDAGIWRGLMDPLTKSEVAAAFASSSLDKAPGDSGVSLRIYHAVFKACPDAVLAVVNTCIAARKTPHSWRHGAIYLIPKTPAGFTGTANATRPITLLETLSKLAMKALLMRITKVLVSHPVLLGAKYSGLPGTDTTTPIALLHAAAAQAKARREQLWVYFEDKSKAFDSVPHDLLRLALERIKLPPSFVQFYCDGSLAGRTAHVLTAFGPSARLAMHRGIPQGAVESPLMWNVFYDVCLSALVTLAEANRAPPTPGPTLRTPPAPPTVRGVQLQAAAGMARRVNTWQPPTRVLATTTLVAVAYMDDAAFYASSRDELQLLVNLVAEFNSLARVRANAGKGAVLALTPGAGGHDQLEVNGADGKPAPIPWLPANGFRYLGVWLDRSMTGAASANQAFGELTKGLTTLRRRRVPAKIATYIVNAVLVPAFLYRTRIGIPAMHRLEAADKQLRALARTMLGRSESVCNASLHMRNVLGLTSLVDAVAQQHTTDLLVLLNSPPGSDGRVAAQCELGLLQEATRCLVSPLADPTQALAAWHPNAASRISWFDELLPILAARRLSVSDDGGAFDLQCLGKHSVAMRVPWLVRPSILGPGTRVTPSPWLTWAKANTVYTLEQLLPSDSLPHGQVLLVDEVLQARRRHCGGGATLRVGKYDRMLAAAIARCRADPLQPCRPAATAAGPPSPRRDVSHEVTDGQELQVFDPQPQATATRRLLQPASTHGKVVVFTDGSYDPPSLVAAAAADGSVLDQAAVEVAGRTAAGCTYPGIGTEASVAIPATLSSSTRAELAGALLAVSLAPAGCHLVVCSDSQAMVRASQRLVPQRSMAPSPRCRVRAANADLWAAIRHVAGSRGLRLSMRWVRGHAGIAANERADALARQALGTAPSSIKALLAKSDLPCRLQFDGAGVPGDPRRFMACLADELHIGVLAVRSSIPAPIATEWNSIHWRAAARALHAGDGPRGRLASRATSSAFRFRIRVLCGVLPSGVGLHSLGKAASPDCICGQPDAIDHWLVCSGNRLALAAATAALANHLHARQCSSRPVAAAWARSMVHLRAAACLVTTADIEWYKLNIAGPGLARRRGTGANGDARVPGTRPSAARMVALAHHQASLLLQGAWSQHAARLADARPPPLRPAASVADQPQGPEPATATTASDQRRGRCLRCLVPHRRHVATTCTAMAAALDRTALVLGGYPLTNAAGFAHAAPLA